MSGATWAIFMRDPLAMGEVDESRLVGLYRNRRATPLFLHSRNAVVAFGRLRHPTRRGT
jgi:hypothetical protein